MYGAIISCGTWIYLLKVVSAASAPIIRSASFPPKALIGPCIGLVPLFVSMYIPILDVSISLLPSTFVTTGVTGAPFAVIVAVAAPAGALISITFTPFISSSFPVGLLPGVNSSAAPPLTVIVPKFLTIPPVVMNLA